METAITGIAIFSPLGKNAPETWDALLAGAHVTDHTSLSATGDRSLRVIEFALSAATEAIAQARWTRAMLADERTALVVGTSRGNIESWLTPPLHMSVMPYIEAGGFGLAQVTSAVAAELNFGVGPRLTVSAACSSGLQALIRGHLMLLGGEADRVLVVAAEASVHPLFLASFKRLGVLAPPGGRCRPFDVNRAGFLMSEAAVAVCLEHPNGHSPHARHSPSRSPLACVERFALGSDATNITSGDPGGAVLCHLLARVLDGRPVDLVHAHGTATRVNDQVELSAIEASLDSCDERPILYSHKGALGRSIGAAGLLSVAINCMAHDKGMVPPNICTTAPMPMLRVDLPREIRRRPIRRSAVICAGFGGPTAVLTLQSP